MPFVLDASFAACWAFDDEDHPVAALALERVRTDEARVPSLWWFEVRNALMVSERRGRLTEALPQSHRTHALPFEGLETHRNPFRETPTYFAATALAAAILWWT